jgi:hypothetical protein
VTSSPPLTSDTGVPLFTLRRNAKPGGSTAFMDYGAEGHLDKLDEIDLYAVALALKTNPNAPERISEEAILREQAALTERGYARERIGIWPPDLEAGFTVITKDQWLAMLDPYSGKERYEDLPATMEYWPEPDLPLSDPAWQVPPTRLVGRPVVSVDVSPRIGGQVKASIGLASRRQDGKRHIEMIKTGSGSDWTIQALVTLHMTTKAMIAIDPGSPAGSLLADLITALRTAYKDPNLDTSTIILTMAARDVAQAFGMIYDAATRPVSEPRTVVHLGQDELTLAVGGADKRNVGDGHAWDRREASADITSLISVTHALWGLAKAPAEVESVPMVMWA